MSGLKTYYDVAIAGAGPAGSILAARLARAGADTLLVEASGFEGPRAGEFLSPQARSMINRSEILPTGWERRHQPIHEFTGSWGSAQRFARDFIFEAQGHALALDRASFDRELAEAAALHGATLETHAKVCTAERHGGEWTIGIERGAEHCSVRAGFIVVCCGRNGMIQGIPTRRQRLDRLFCLGLRMGNCPGDIGASIESYARGWAYSVKLESGELVVNVCTESAGQRRQFGSVEALLEELAHCPIAAARVLSCQAMSASDVSLFAADASSAVSRPAAGEGWRMAGDCAQSMDPLSAGGIMSALDHAEMILDDFTRAKSLRDAEFGVYCARLDDNYRNYLTARRRFYGMEKRWASPFWEKRREEIALP